MICYWDLDEGQLVRSLENDTGEPVDLACTSQLLIGYGSGLYFYLWDKFNGQLVTRITPAISEVKYQTLYSYIQGVAKKTGMWAIFSSFST